MGRNMTASDTPNSAAERKRARRHKVARRLYEQLVAQNPNRVITLRDSAGKVVARHDLRPEQDAQTLPHRHSDGVLTSYPGVGN